MARKSFKRAPRHDANDAGVVIKFDNESVASSNKPYDLLFKAFEGIVTLATALTTDFAALSGSSEQDVAHTSIQNPDVFQNFRIRANSELLSIAFFGAFSSGKSFLISGLNGTLDWFQYLDPTTSTFRDGYAALLPSSSLHTSSCPVAVEPLPGDEKDNMFWVFFKENQAWERKAPVKASIVQAYVSDLPDALAERDPHDRTRSVVKARLGISDPRIPARLYDLPGFGSIGTNYEGVIREFVQQTDCLVYCAWSMRSLEEKDLELLRHVYEHYQATGKPVIFVLTQIDRNLDYDTSRQRIGWEAVLERNNEFLRTYFLDSTGQPDRAFIGKGFMPISAALEAKAQGIAAVQSNEARILLANSRMSDLRNMFLSYLQSKSGPVHLSELITEIEFLVVKMRQDIQSRTVAEAVPLYEAKATIKTYSQQKDALIAGKSEIQKVLTEQGNAVILRTFTYTAPDDLTHLLMERLKEKIETKDVLKDDVVHEIETERMSLVREWLSRDNRAPILEWQKAWSLYVSSSQDVMEKLFRDASIAAKGPNETLEADLAKANGEGRPVLQYRDEWEKNFKETVGVFNNTMKTISIVSGTGGAAASLAGLGFGAGVAGASGTLGAAALLLTPVGHALIAATFVAVGYGRIKHRQHLQERRQSMLQDIPSYSQAVVQSYRQQANEFIQVRIGQLIEIVDNEIERLNASIGTLEQRLSSGEFVDRERRLQDLDRLADRSREIHERISQFYQMASTISREAERSR